MLADLTTQLLFEVTGTDHREVNTAIERTIESYLGKKGEWPTEIDIDARPEIVSAAGAVVRWSAWCTVKWSVRI